MFTYLDSTYLITMIGMPVTSGPELRDKIEDPNERTAAVYQVTGEITVAFILGDFSGR